MHFTDSSKKILTFLKFTLDLFFFALFFFCFCFFASSEFNFKKDIQYPPNRCSISLVHIN